MSSSRQLHLGAFMRPASIHTGAWRYPGAWPDMNFNFPHLKQSIQALERAKFDAFFMADHMAVLNMPMDALKRSHTATSFEPFTLLSALSQVTERIGLVATGSTTFDAPYHIARRFASLDHLSEGRAGWNIVTTSNPDAALNFGLDEHMEHGERYHRAREFYDVVTGLWDSWADDAFIRDVENGIFFDPAKMHVLNHKGEYYVGARPAQYRAAGPGLAGDRTGRRFGIRPQARRRNRGSGVHRAKRSRCRQKVLCRREGPHGKARPRARAHENSPRLFRRRRRHGGGGEGETAKLDSLVDYANAIASLSIALGHDASKFDPDKPLPETFRRAMPPRAGASAPSRSAASATTSPCASLRNGSAAIPALP